MHYKAKVSQVDLEESKRTIGQACLQLVSSKCLDEDPQRGWINRVYDLTLDDLERELAACRKTCRDQESRQAAVHKYWQQVAQLATTPRNS